MKQQRIPAFLLSAAMTLSLFPTFAPTASAEGTQTTPIEKNITLCSAALSGYDSTNDIKLFNEQINGDYKTGYSSPASNISIETGLEGSGTKQSPYTISDIDDLEYFRNNVNNGNTYADKFVKLTADINIGETYNSSTENSWTPIGSSSNPFKGTFDGNGKKIEGLYINQTQNIKGSGNGKGLFGYVTDGTVKNLSVYGTVKSVGNYIGAIVGKLTDGTIENCTNECDVTGRTSVGGIVGIALNNCTLKSCTNNKKVDGKGQWNNGAYSGGSSIGGIVGYASSQTKVENCRNSENISAEGDTAGGIVGYATIDGEASAKISNCYSIGRANAKNNTGGIVGYDNAKDVTNCYYLLGTNYSNTKGTTKTADEFASGEVAWLLQNGQTEKATQVWGQKLSDTAADGESSNKDTYPVLSSEDAKSVKKVSFKITDSESENGYTDYAVRYANKGVFGDKFPDSTFEDYKIIRWVLDKNDINSTEFTKNTTIDGDISVYGVKRELTVESNVSKTIDCDKNNTITVDLTKYVENMSGEEQKSFGFIIDYDNSTLSEDWIGEDSTESKLKITPKKVGTYKLALKVSNNGVSAAELQSGETPSEVSSFTLTFNVNLEKDKTAANTTYLISDVDELKFFRDSVNNGNSYTGKYIKLTADIDLTGHTWTPIGVNYSDFEGIFDGQGHTISNMKFTTVQNGYGNDHLTYDYQGLFGVIRNKAIVRNFTVKGEITLAANGQKYIGGAVGCAYGGALVSNVTSYVDITDDGNSYNDIDYIGGIVGRTGSSRTDNVSEGYVDWCKYYGKINIEKADDVGGIVGCTIKGGSVTNSTNYGTVGWNYIGHIGGIVGSANNGTLVKNCANYGSVSAHCHDCIGGIVGYVSDEVTITNCLNAGNISGQPADSGINGSYIGGILGYQNNSSFNGITNCFNYGKLTATDNKYAYTGAIIGWSRTESSGKKITGNYYLNTSLAGSTQKAVGDGTIGTNTSVTAAQAASGEIAYNMQAYITNDEKVWGQKLTGENKALYPILGGDAVHKVTFMVSEEAYATRYANETLVGTLPSCPSTNGIWRLGTSVIDTEFTAETPISSDITVYEVMKTEPNVTISTVEKLKEFRDSVNSGTSYEGQYIKLTADLDLAGSNDNQWTAIGTKDNPFKGMFDGNGHKINGLYINNSSYYQGLFGYVGENGIIHYLNVYGTVKGYSSVGGIVGVNEGTVQNCSYSGLVSGTNWYVGGVAGYNEKTVTNCYNTSDVNGTCGTGGVIGFNYYGTIKNCYNTGNVNGTLWVGGAIGSNRGLSENCYNIGRVCGTNGHTGGVIGYEYGGINETASNKNCFYLDTCAAKGTTFDSTLGTALTAAQMRNSASFTNWDFTSIWKINIDRPLLKNNLEVQKFGITSIGTNDTKATATVFTFEAGTYTVVFADYENGKLNNVDIVPLTVTATQLGENTVTSAKAITLGTEDKIMLWDSLENLVPLCKAYVIK